MYRQYKIFTIPLKFLLLTLRYVIVHVHVVLLNLVQNMMQRLAFVTLHCCIDLWTHVMCHILNLYIVYSLNYCPLTHNTVHPVQLFSNVLYNYSNRLLMKFSVNCWEGRLSTYPLCPHVSNTYLYFNIHDGSKVKYMEETMATR